MKSNGRRKSNALRISLCLLLALAMTITMMPANFRTAYADDDEESSVRDTYENVMQTAVPGTFLDENYEPYGFGKDVPFIMNQQSEILFYLMNEDICQEGGDITTFYDTLKAGNTEDIFKGAPKTSAMKNPPIDLRKASYVQAVSFDPRGTGRKDHIAFIGVNSSKYAYVWVYDTRNKKWYTSSGSNGGYSIVRCNWMNSEYPSSYEAANFLSITAGDYDNDGKDTLIVYAIGDYVDDSTYRYQLYEIQVDSPAIGSSGSISISNRKTVRSFIYSYKYAKETENKYRLGCDLASGDINGDGIDDLAAVSYYGDIRNSNQSAAFYRPYLCVYYGEPGKNIFRTVGSSVGLWEGWKNESTDKIKNKSWKSMVSPGIACGDIDNDGVDEIVAAGIKNTIHANGAANAGNPKDIDKYTLSVYIVDNGQVIEKEVAANEWTTNGFYVDDKVWNKTAVECVAVNGMGNPENVFISGTLYDFDSKSGNLTALETPGYFKNAGDNLEFKASTNMFIQSTAAGNFDGNDKGFEQVVFTVSCKTQSYENYDYLMGVIGGKNHNEMSGIASGYYSTSKGSMDDDNSYPRRVSQSNWAGNISEDSGLNCIAIAVDSDNDGMLVRYKEKTLTNSDPDVLCVLQAAPYFKELEPYIDCKGETKYTITNTYSYERSETTSSSFGVAGVVKLGTPACEIEVQSGYAREWSQEFTEGHETSEAYWWSAAGKDKVVVYRTPVVSYKYQVQDPTGLWESNGEDNSLIISVPTDPAYTTMSIDQYNAFAEYYNAEMAKKTNKFRHLQKLNNKWLGHEGEPDKYISADNSLFDEANNGYERIQKKYQTVNHDSGSSGYSLEEGTSSSVTESVEHGYTFEASVGVGPDLGPVSFSVGVSASLENMSGQSTTISQATSKGIECTVMNIDDEEVPASLKPGKFAMSYKVATWPSGLKSFVKGEQNQIVPVFGYALSGVCNPVKAAGLTPEELEAMPVIELLETIKDSSEITLDDEDDIRYIREEYEKLSDEAKKLVNVNILILAEKKIEILKEYESAETMDITGWVMGLSETSFTYNGSVQRPQVRSIWGFPLNEGTDYELSWSDPSSTNAGTYTVSATGKGRYKGTATAEYKIVPKSIKGANVKVAEGDYTYTGSAFTPDVTVTLDGVQLTKDDYNASYSNNVEVGNAKVTVEGKGNYKGTAEGTFEIKATSSDNDPDDPNNPDDPTDPDDPNDPDDPTDPDDPNDPDQPIDPDDKPVKDPTQEMGVDGTPYSKDASFEAVDKAIKSLKSEKDPKGTAFAKLLLKQSKATNKTVKITWNKVSGAKKYVVYASKCGLTNKPKKVATTTKTSYTLKKISKKALKKGTYYKFIVTALNKKNKVITTSKLIHIATSGTNYGNAKGITTKAKNDKVSLKVKKTFKLGAKTTLASKKIKVKNHVGIRYESTNTKIAKVSSKGVITAKKKGTCYVYVYAQNGFYKKIKVTVK